MNILVYLLPTSVSLSVDKVPVVGQRVVIMTFLWTLPHYLLRRVP